MKKKLSLLIYLSLALFIGIKASAQGKVHVIEFINQNENILVTGISADGSKVTGYDYVGSYSFLWTKEEGVQIVDRGRGGSASLAVSNNGILTGQFADSTLIYTNEYGDSQSLASAGYFKDGRWYSLGLKEGIPPMEHGGSSSYAISADGTLIGGSRKVVPDAGIDMLEPVIWKINGENISVQILEYTQTGQGAKVTAMSANGKVAGGFAAPFNMRTPVIWKDGKIKEIKAYDIVPNGEVHGISPNGRYAALSMEGKAALYDIEEDKLTIIETQKDALSSSATHVSNDGIVVGYCQVGNIGLTDRVTFIYSESLGAITLKDYLKSMQIDFATNLTFGTSMGISADGKRLVGFGDILLPGGQFLVGWIVEIDKHLTLVNPARELSAVEDGIGNIKLTWNVPNEENMIQPLQGYNIYRNGEKINDQLVTRTEYKDNSLENGTYSYTVTAIWGDNEESKPTTEVKISTALLDLPFFDDFASANIDSLFWNMSSTGARWYIDSYSGIQPPSLAYYTPIGTTYEESITSPWINANYTSDLQLGFNIVIPYSENSGSDSLRVEVFNGEEWHTVAHYGATTQSTFSFEPKTIDISTIAAGKTIRVRFTCHGDNKDGGIAWLLDNINLYTQRNKFKVERPLNVTAHRTDEGKVRVNWSDPKEVATLSYLPNDDAYGAIGNEGNSIMGVNMFAPKDLKGYNGYYLTHISAYLNYYYWLPESAKYRLVVFKGDRQVVSQDIEEYTPNAWNTFALKRTIFVDASLPLYFGIEVVEHDPEDRPIATCEGVIAYTSDGQTLFVNEGRSNLYSEDGGKSWQHLTSEIMDGENYTSIAVKATISKDRPATSKDRIMGYRVYRNGDDLLGMDWNGNRLLTAMNNYTDLSAPDEDCYYTVSTYYITQVESEESNPAYIEGVINTRSNTTSNAKDPMNTTNSVKIYNVQNDLHVVTNHTGVLSIYTTNGNLHSQRNIPAGDTVINLSAGIYIIQFDNTSQKIIIN